MVCPLLTIGGMSTEAGVRALMKIGSDGIDCFKENCAWWMDKSTHSDRVCAIKSIAMSMELRDLKESNPLKENA